MANDYDLNLDYASNSSYIFIIYYKKEDNKYYLRTFKDKQISGLWILMIKLDREYQLIQKEIISISDHFFQIITNQDKIEIKKLELKNSTNSEYLSIM
jgi:hypothetical protein